MFKQKNTYKKNSEQTVSKHPIHIYNEFKHIIIYAIHSCECIFSFLRKQHCFRDYLADNIFLETIWLITFFRDFLADNICLETIWLIPFFRDYLADNTI